MMREQPPDELTQPQRRHVIMAVAAVAGLAAAIKSPSAWMAEGADASGALLARVLQALGEPVPEQVRGSRSVTHEAVEQYLVRILRIPLSELAPDISERDLKARIRDNIAADYRNGDIRIVAGWWLSAAEAQCLELIERVRAA